ncbi:FtsW/RodA/SpoVE family cell cycle protein [Neobacillus sp. PS3-34]|uniref:FtsW/RodA/SpoVE family cell cycle protein n=1 Tax=Neobacillus sp. PS3-34 TaxID=3070678 RepID=UPI0027E0E811|nr:FtsW/RodA/SpoVE family cell cycle protein [Neobacillus sp. PS3-34]WML48009.1 FtsW/RodA/SpoVE family cell cycle protein [Neobacillus sp. PS3-34]
MMNKIEFLNAVNKNIRSREAREKVSKELEQHIKQTTDELQNQGIPLTEAELKAVEQMGSPLTLGAKFNQLYKPKMDWVLAILFLVALGLGVLPLIVLGNSFHHLKWGSKIAGMIAGIVIVFGLQLVNYKSWEKRGMYFYIFATTVLLIALNAQHFFPFMLYINGRPYFKFGPFLTDASIVLPIYLVAWSSFFVNSKIKLWMLGILFFPSLILLLNTSNLTIVGIYVVMVMVMFWFSGRSHILRTSLVMAIIGAGALFFIWSNSHELQKRFSAFLFPYNDPNSAGFMAIRAKDILSEAKWGFQAIPKDGLLIPGSHADLVLLSLTYSLGWGFSLILLALLSVIIIKMALTSANITTLFGKLLVIGGMTIYAVQLLYNVGMIFGLFPIAGMSLPFISYGTIPILINSIVIGLSLSIYRRKAFV